MKLTAHTVFTRVRPTLPPFFFKLGADLTQGRLMGAH